MPIEPKNGMSELDQLWIDADWSKNSLERFVEDNIAYFHQNYPDHKYVFRVINESIDKHTNEQAKKMNTGDKTTRMFSEMPEHGISDPKRYYHTEEHNVLRKIHAHAVLFKRFGKMTYEIGTESFNPKELQDLIDSYLNDKELLSYVQFSKRSWLTKMYGVLEEKRMLSAQQTLILEGILVLAHCRRKNEEVGTVYLDRTGNADFVLKSSKIINYFLYGADSREMVSTEEVLMFKDRFYTGPGSIASLNLPDFLKKNMRNKKYVLEALEQYLAIIDPITHNIKSVEKAAYKGVDEPFPDA